MDPRGVPPFTFATGHPNASPSISTVIQDIHTVLVTILLSCRKVLFSVVSVILLRGAGGSLVQGPAPSIFKLVHSEARSVGQRAVRIRLIYLLVTVHKRSCGKVMFSQVCVKNSVQEGCLPQCMLRYTPRQTSPWADTPPPADRYCCGRCASYWNAFLSWNTFKGASRDPFMLINFIADSCGNIVRGGFRLQIRGSQEGGADTGRVSARG